MRLSMKKEQPASSTILPLDWLATETKKTTELHVYALKIVVILQTWHSVCEPLPFPSEVNIFFVHSFYYLVHVVLTLNIVHVISLETIPDILPKG